jgi:hypothetical protein
LLEQLFHGVIQKQLQADVSSANGFQRLLQLERGVCWDCKPGSPIINHAYAGLHAATLPPLPASKEGSRPWASSDRVVTAYLGQLRQHR